MRDILEKGGNGAGLGRLKTEDHRLKTAMREGGRLKTEDYRLKTAMRDEPGETVD